MYRTVVFSLATDVCSVYESLDGNLPICVENESFNCEILLDRCRELLHKTYVLEQGWNVPTGTATSTFFNIRRSNMLPNNPWMLCDKYDYQNSYWVYVENKKTQKIVACCRIVTKEHDIFNYEVPKTTMMEHFDVSSALEVQRVAISFKERKSSLFEHLYYSSCLFASEKLPNATIFTTSSNSQNINFLKSVGFNGDHSLVFRYLFSDSQSSLLYMDPKKMVKAMKNRMLSKL